MKMTTKIAAVLLGRGSCLVVTGVGPRATRRKWMPKPRRESSGSRKVRRQSMSPNIRKAIQDNYEVFSQKCSQCHKLSRPINSDYALPDEWSRYIKRMMYKPGSNISAGRWQEDLRVSGL